MALAGALRLKLPPGFFRRPVEGLKLESLKPAVLGFLALALLSLFSLGLVAGYQALSASRLFGLSRLELSGNRHLTKGDVLSIAGLNLGVSLLRLDPEAVRLRLLTSPWVAKAQVRRVLPDELQVWIVERRPAALALARQAWYVDGEGRAFKTVSPGENLDLPVITGLKEDELGSETAPDLLVQALEAIRLLKEPGVPVPAGLLSEVQIRADQGLVLHFLPKRPRIILGRGELPAKMGRWKRVQADLETKGLLGKAGYLDLRLIDQVFVSLERD